MIRAVLTYLGLLSLFLIIWVYIVYALAPHIPHTELTILNFIVSFIVGGLLIVTTLEINDLWD